MASTRSLEARTAAELRPLLRVIAKLEFKESAIVFDRGGRYVAIPFTVKFGPDAGGWTLLIRNVTAWSIRHRGEHDLEVLETIEYDASRGLVVVKCLMDHMEAEVEELDVRLTHAGSADDAAKSYEDLPPLFRKDVEELKRKRAEERVRREGARKRIAWHGAAASAVYSMILATLAGGSVAVVLGLAPLVAGGVGFFCVRTGIGPRSSAPFYGLAGVAVLGAAISGGGGVSGIMGGALAFLCGTLLHVVGGVAILIWMREKLSLRS